MREIYEEEKIENIEDGVGKKGLEKCNTEMDRTEEKFVIDTDKGDEIRRYPFLPSEKHKDSYINIVEDGSTKSPESDTKSQENIREAYKEIYELIEEEVHDLRYRQRINTLDNLRSALITRFTVMHYEINKDSKQEAMKESALYFGCINDRGQDLYELDRIKSHILYTHSLVSDSVDDSDYITKEEIHNKFVTVEENIQRCSGNYGSNIEDFTTHFFYMFTGTDKIDSKNRISNKRDNLTSASDRIKYAEHNLPSSQIEDSDPERALMWIECFADSIEDASKSYYRINEASCEPTDSERANELIYVCKSFFPKRGQSLRLAADLALRNNVEIYKEILSIIEKIAIRCFEIQMIRSTTKEGQFMQMASELFWSSISYDPSEIFDYEGDHKMIETFENEEVSAEELKSKLNSILIDQAYDDSGTDLAKEKVEEANIITGDGEGNYGGMRNGEETGRYLLVKYEESLTNRRKVTNSITEPFYIYENPSDFDREYEWRLTYEDVWPKSQSEDIAYNKENDTKENEPYNKLVGMIGNGYLLRLKSNSTASDKPYDEKYSTYENKGAEKMLNEMPSKDEGWSETTIEKRSEDIAEQLFENGFLEVPDPKSENNEKK